jgi:hypothetical protein
MVRGSWLCVQRPLAGLLVTSVVLSGWLLPGCSDSAVGDRATKHADTAVASDGAVTEVADTALAEDLLQDAEQEVAGSDAAGGDANEVQPDAEVATTDAGQLHTDTEVAATDAAPDPTDADVGETDADGTQTDAGDAAPDTAPGQTDAQTAATDIEQGQSDSEIAATDIEQGQSDSEIAATDIEPGQSDSETAATDIEQGQSDTEIAATDAESGQSDTEIATTDAESGQSDAEIATTDAESGQSDTETADVAQPTPLTCGQAGVRVLHSVPWAGNGLQLYVSLPPDASPAEPPTLVLSSGDVVAAEVVPPSVAAGYTLLVVVPVADATEHEAMLAAAVALAQALPAAEQIAVAVADAAGDVSLVVDYTAERATVTAALQQLAAVSAAVPSPTVLLGQANWQAQTGDPWGPVDRELVVVTAVAPAVAWPDPAAWPPAVALRWLTASAADVALSWPDLSPAAAAHWQTSDPATAGTSLAAAVASTRAKVVRIGACGVGASATATLQWGGASCLFALPEPADELPDLACAATAAAADASELGNTVDFTLTPEQLAVWQNFYNTKTEDDFALSVTIGNAAPITAKAHFRGQTSMDCARKSYEVNLKGSKARRLWPNGGGDEFMLVSMCKDIGLHNQVFANRLLAPLGLFPLPQRYVRLRLNGINQGVYLLLGDPEDVLASRQLALAGLIRRKLDPVPTEVPEVKLPKLPAQADLALADYETMGTAAMTAEPDTLAAALAPKLDTTSYWRWMAAMTLLGNGDYVDEVYFYTSQEAAGWRWRPLGWDADDLFSTCHHNSQYAMQDPYGLLYCAEGDLDHALVRSDVVYAQWAAELQVLIDAWNPTVAKAEMDALAAELLPLLDDETALALTEVSPKPADGAAAVAWLQGRMDLTLQKLAANRTALQKKLVAWQADKAAQSAPPPPPAAPAWRQDGPRVIPPGVAVPVVLASLVPAWSGSVAVEIPGVATADALVVEGRGSLAVQAPAEQGPWTVVVDPTGAAVPLTYEVQKRPLHLVAGALSGADLVWTAAQDIVVTADATVAAGQTLQIGPGTRIRLSPNVRLRIDGNLVSNGTADQPVWFLPNDTAAWGEVDIAGEATLQETWLTGGGGDPSRAFGHSASQPVVRVATGAALTMKGGGVTDSPGKAFGSTAATVVLANVLVTRCDTGGEHEGSAVSMNRCHTLQIPDGDGIASDDDNDALYLADNGQTGAQSTITNSVFAVGEDDGIDQNGASVVISNCRLANFAHEGIAASNGGLVMVSDSMVRGCEQGVEAGYGSPQVEVHRCLLTQNGTGLRWGDSYPTAANGTLLVTDSVATDNTVHNVWLSDPQDGPAPAASIALSCSLLGEGPWLAEAGNQPDAVLWSPLGQIRTPPPRPAGCGPLGPQPANLAPPLLQIVLDVEPGVLTTWPATDNAGPATVANVRVGVAGSGLLALSGATVQQLAAPAGTPKPELAVGFALDSVPTLDLFGEGAEPQTGLVLHAMWQDPTWLRSWLGASLLRAEGGLSPRLAFAEVWLGGQWLGLYVVQEAEDAALLARLGIGGSAPTTYLATGPDADWTLASEPLAGWVQSCCGPSGPDAAAALQDLRSTAAAAAATDSAINLEVAPLVSLADVLSRQRIGAWGRLARLVNNGLQLGLCPSSTWHGVAVVAQHSHLRRRFGCGRQRAGTTMAWCRWLFSQIADGTGLAGCAPGPVGGGAGHDPASCSGASADRRGCGSIRRRSRPGRGGLAAHYRLAHGSRSAAASGSGSSGGAAGPGGEFAAALTAQCRLYGWLAGGMAGGMAQAQTETTVAGRGPLMAPRPEKPARPLLLALHGPVTAHRPVLTHRTRHQNGPQNRWPPAGQTLLL